jgi:hypothetical protein
MRSDQVRAIPETAWSLIYAAAAHVRPRGGWIRRAKPSIPACDFCAAQSPKQQFLNHLGRQTLSAAFRDRLSGSPRQCSLDAWHDLHPQSIST